MILYTLLFSSAITFISTCVQLALDYKRDVNAIRIRLDTVKKTHLHGVINSVWNMDDKQTVTLLSGILQLPDIEHLQIKNHRGKSIASVGQLPHWGRKSVSYPLEFVNLHAKTIDLGVLIVTASLEGVYDRLKDKVVVILVSQGIKTFLVSGFIFLLFQYLVTRHLATLAEYAKKTNLGRLDEPLRLDREVDPNTAEDEFDRVVNELNNMRLRMWHDESVLKKSEEKYRSLVENIGSSFILYSHDTNGVFTYVSPSITTILGYTTDEFLFHFDTYLTDNPINKNVVRHTQLSIAGQQQPRYHVEVYAKNGEIHLLEVLESPVFGSDNKVVSVDGIAQDITDRTRIEKERNAKIIAESANRAKSEFLATMSHEIRTPMNAVQGSVELLRRQQLSPEADDLVATISKSTTLLLNILDDILDLSMVEEGRLSLEAVDFNLGDLLRQLVATMTPSVVAKGLQLQLSVAPETPETVNGDPARLHQVLANLIGNAVKFTKQGAIAIDVRLMSSAADGVTLAFVVKDDGCGIPAENIHAIFNPFVQVDPSISRQQQGAGLGLAICKNLVTLMGGDIEVDSVVGKGSEFRVFLPFKKAENMVVTKSPEPQDAPPALSLLLVDDDAVSQVIVAGLLSDEGYEVEVAASGTAALEMVGRRSFDVILMDLRMPGMDGFETTRHIRGHADQKIAGTKIAAFTADVMKETVERCLAEGMDTVIAKPIDVSDVNRVLSALFAGSAK